MMSTKEVLSSTAQYSTALHCTAQHCTALHSTAQHSTSQRHSSIAQHSTHLWTPQETDRSRENVHLGRYVRTITLRYRQCIPKKHTVLTVTATVSYFTVLLHSASGYYSQIFTQRYLCHLITILYCTLVRYCTVLQYVTVLYFST